MTEDRDHWIVFPSGLSLSEVTAEYYNITGRRPDRIHSPKNSGLNFWFLGWLSRDEYQKYKSKIGGNGKK